jgi:hypothetical protein
VQKQPILVGEEAVAAQAIGLQGQLEVLYPAFGFSPIYNWSHIPVVELGRIIGTTAHNEAGVCTLL